MVQQFAQLLLHNLQIAQLVLQIDTHFVDLQFAQRNLQNVQIPRLHGTCMYIYPYINYARLALLSV